MINIIGNKTDFFFIKFPIIFPLMYGFFLFSFPNYENIIILVTILILAETHFGVTWPFFLNKINYSYIFKNKIYLIYLPLFIIAGCFILYFYFKSTFLLIFFGANVYHVTRQSIGIVKIYNLDIKKLRFEIFFLYCFNFLFFIIGFTRFYLKINLDLYILNYLLLFLLLILFFFYFITFKNLNTFLTFLTGIIIFWPIAFVSNPVHGIIAGVTMHYSQYLVLTNKVIIKRKNNFINKNFFLELVTSKYIYIIIIYSVLMTYLSFLSKSNLSFVKDLIVLPITSQMLHFYLDSQLWKFSSQHIRETVLFFLKEKY
jgi:hypothetical protein